MIKLRGKTGEANINNKIIFEPRSGFNRGKGAAATLEFPLIYGHKCPVCSNVMQALFKAPKLFSLWPYEETKILSQGEKNSGEVGGIFPDEKTRQGKSCYRMYFSPAEGGSIKIVLRNHIMQHTALATRKFNGEGLWEEGYKRPCNKTGIFSLRDDLLIKDWLLFSLIGEYDVQKYNIPPIKDLIKEDDHHFQLASAVGIAPPVILMERQSLVYGFHYLTRPAMAEYRKPGQ